MWKEWRMLTEAERETKQITRSQEWKETVEGKIGGEKGRGEEGRGREGGRGGGEIRRRRE